MGKAMNKENIREVALWLIRSILSVGMVVSAMRSNFDATAIISGVIVATFIFD